MLASVTLQPHGSLELWPSVLPMKEQTGAGDLLANLSDSSPEIQPMGTAEAALHGVLGESIMFPSTGPDTPLTRPEFMSSLMAS